MRNHQLLYKFLQSLLDLLGLIPLLTSSVYSLVWVQCFWFYILWVVPWGCSQILRIGHANLFIKLLVKEEIPALAEKLLVVELKSNLEEDVVQAIVGQTESVAHLLIDTIVKVSVMPLNKTHIVPL